MRLRVSVHACLLGNVVHPHTQLELEEKAPPSHQYMRTDMRLRVSVHACLLENVLLPTHTAGTGRESPTITSVHNISSYYTPTCNKRLR
jgi:hypothetical protein